MGIENKVKFYCPSCGKPQYTDPRGQNKTHNTHYYEEKCPDCGNHFPTGYGRFKYCQSCGTLLKYKSTYWSDFFYTSECPKCERIYNID